MHTNAANFSVRCYSERKTLKMRIEAKEIRMNTVAETRPRDSGT